MVFVHCCEYAQALHDPEIGEGIIREIVSMERESYQNIVDQGTRFAVALRFHHLRPAFCHLH